MNYKKFIIAIFLSVILVIIIYWIWNNQQNITQNKNISQVGNIIEGKFIVIPSDPTMRIIGFQSCDGTEYYQGFETPNLDFSNNQDPIFDQVFQLVNPRIGCENITFHSYEPGTTREACNVIQIVDEIIQIDKCDCDKYNGEKKTMCYYLFDKVRLTDEVCSQGNGDIKDYCYRELASITKDENICLKAGKRMDGCYLNLAQLKQNELLCEQITAQNVRDNCYYQLAILKRNKSLCEKIVGNKEYYTNECDSKLKN